jgi:hypothetical protein
MGARFVANVALLFVLELKKRTQEFPVFTIRIGFDSREGGLFVIYGWRSTPFLFGNLLVLRPY